MLQKRTDNGWLGVLLGAIILILMGAAIVMQLIIG